MRTANMIAFIRTFVLTAILILPAQSALAASVTTFDFTLVPQALAGPAFGITSLPADPANLSITIDGALAPGEFTYAIVSAAFSINGRNFSLADFTSSRAHLTVDESATVIDYSFRLSGGSAGAGMGPGVIEVETGSTNVAWYAIDYTVGGGCGFSDLPLQVVSAGCIAGSPGRDTPGLLLIPNSVSYRITTTEVPEPATAVFIGVGLAGLAWPRRRDADALGTRSIGSRLLDEAN